MSLRLSAAERQRLYRQRRDADPIKREAYLQKQKDTWVKRKQLGHVKSISELKDRAQRKLRKTWRMERSRNRKKRAFISAQLSAIETPPTSPNPPVDYPANDPTMKRKKGDTQRRKNRKKVIQEIATLQMMLGKQERLSAKYKKRWQRSRQEEQVAPLGQSNTPCQRARNEGHIAPRVNCNTPRSKTAMLLRGSRTSPALRKALLFHNVLVHQMRSNFAATGQRNRKREYVKLILGSMTRKYRVKQQLQTGIGFTSKYSKKRADLTSRTRYSSRGIRYGRIVREFYVRDDNSRATSGKKETLTRNQDKKQKRLLCDTMKNLHLKFVAETPDSCISYSLFCRLRPFWVVMPNAGDRQTCLCKLHENCGFVLSKLASLKVLATADIDTILNNTVCDVTSKVCMYGDCPDCCVTNLGASDLEDGNVPSDSNCTWFQWKTVKEERIIRGKSKMISFTVKATVSGTVNSLLAEATKLVHAMKRHTYNITHQAIFYRKLRQEMDVNECILHIDFAENYACKLGKEIQSMHFGASKRQITLHTGVQYLSNAEPVSFCSISDSLEHNPAGIWGHLTPVLDDLAKEHPQIDTLHMFSDGPTAQYKQKGNFYLFAKQLERRGFRFGTWNYFEAAHGKGAPDGVGAAIKRNTDRLVNMGRDCTDADTMYELLATTGSKVKMYVTSQRLIDDASRDLERARDKIPTLKGTMRMHQLIVMSGCHVASRDVSCLCKRGELCGCYAPRHMELPEDMSPTGTGIETEGVDARGSERNISNSTTLARDRYFAEQLAAMQMCENYEGLKILCGSLESEIEDKYNITVGDCVFQNTMLVDIDAQNNIPCDCPGRHLVPVHVSPDGDCLPHTGSMLAFGHERATEELRVRIIVELVMHSECYLANDYLQRGIDVDEDGSIPLTKRFCMYTGHFADINDITMDQVLKSFETETLGIIATGSYMGITEIFALASVLGVPVNSVYPNRGPSGIRADMHRRVLPRVSRSCGEVNIMWTNTRYDGMSDEHFAPNHFVPLMEFTNDNITSEVTNIHLQDKLAQTHIVVRYVDVYTICPSRFNIPPHRNRMLSIHILYHYIIMNTHISIVLV